MSLLSDLQSKIRTVNNITQLIESTTSDDQNVVKPELIESHPADTSIIHAVTPATTRGPSPSKPTKSHTPPKQLSTISFSSPLNTAQALTCVQETKDGVILKCNIGHIQQYNTYTTKCRSCHGPSYLLNIRRYLENLFGVPFLIDNNVIYNSSVRLCVGIVQVGWISIAGANEYTVVKQLPMLRDRFAPEYRVKIPHK